MASIHWSILPAMTQECGAPPEGWEQMPTVQLSGLPSAPRLADLASIFSGSRLCHRVLRPTVGLLEVPDRDPILVRRSGRLRLSRMFAVSCTSSVYSQLLFNGTWMRVVGSQREKVWGEAKELDVTKLYEYSRLRIYAPSNDQAGRPRSV